jgi:hypothetical protein
MNGKYRSRRDHKSKHKSKHKDERRSRKKESRGKARVLYGPPWAHYLDSLPFQEGTPLAPAEEHTETEVVTTDSSLSTPDRQVFMAANETPGPSGTHPDRYFEDISADELSANAPADETNDDKNARRERNTKRNKWRRRLRETLPIRNLTEALDQVESRMHTTPEQCLMSITTIARHAQGMCTGEVITKLVEDAYFMRVDNRVSGPVLKAKPNALITCAPGSSYTHA